MGVSLVKPKPAEERIKGAVRVAFYMRVSTAEQELEGYSPEFQRDQLLDHVRRKDFKGWMTRPEWHFFDVGSGSEMEGRKSLQRLMEVIRRGEVDLVLVWKIDRLSRSLSDLLGLFDEFNRFGVSFASVKEDLDFTGPIGRLIYQVFGALAEFERETIKMRTEEGRRASAMAGNYTGSITPYGFRSVPNVGGKGKKLQIVPAEAEVVKKVFHWFVYDGWNAARIAEELNHLGIQKGRTFGRAHGGKWLEATVRSMLGAEEYRGVFITNRFRLVQKKPRRHEERPKEEWIVVRMPAIIDDILFYMARERLLQTGRRPEKGGGIEQYMLRGKLVEVETGRGFVGYLSAKKTKNYRRKQYLDRGRRVPSISIAAKPLEDFTWGYIEKAINRPEEFLDVHRQRMEAGDEKKKLVEALQFYEGNLSDANRKIERVNEDYYAERISDGERQGLIAKYQDQRDAAFSRKQRIEADLTRLGLYDHACGHLREFSTKFRDDVRGFTDAQKRKLVDLLVERIEILDGEDGRWANVLFRFDPKEIAAAMPGVEPFLCSPKPKGPEIGAKNTMGGGSDDQGYFLFSFPTPLGFLGNNQYKTLNGGRRLAPLLVRHRKDRARAAG